MEFDVYTLGFSNRSWEETLRILRAFRIECLIDIRTLPGSRRTPQFNLEHLKRALPEAGVEYFHLKNLGGLRKPIKGFSILLSPRFLDFYQDFLCALCLLCSAPGRGNSPQRRRGFKVSMRE
jgi:uncharacterized protein (DUF488 family)